MIVYRKPRCLWNGWKCMHDTIHCMEYWTIASCGKIRHENIRPPQKTMMSWLVVSHCPLHPLHRFLDNNNIVEFPDKVFSNLTSLTYLWVHVCMNDGVLYCFMHWAITSKLSFVIILLSETNNQLMSASDCTRVPVCRITSNNDTSQLSSNIFTNLTSWIIVIL